MGEIEDGAFAILETGRLMSQTLPQYKFYADIAELPFVKTKKPTDEVIRELDLVQMPTTIREGTIQPVYGKLSGTYVPREVKEASFFVTNLNNDPEFAEQIINLGKRFCQDSVIIVPKGEEGTFTVQTKESTPV